MEFFELPMKVTVNKCTALKINICMFIYIGNIETSNSTNSVKTSLRSTGAAINTTYEQG